MTEQESIRLNRFLARRGVASRRGADELIAAGRVLVNGVTADVGTVVRPEADDVRVDNKSVDADTPPPLTLLMYKPAGFVTTVRDPQHRPTVLSLARKVVGQAAGLVPVGRLDTDSRGLLLLSTDGELVHRLSHPRYGVSKTYHVTVADFADAKVQRLRSGVTLDDGLAVPLSVTEVEHARDHVIEVVMGEGRKREVRRMCDAVGLRVVDLCRTAYGPLTLEGMAEGEVRHLSRTEVQTLYATVGL